MSKSKKMSKAISKAVTKEVKKALAERAEYTTLIRVPLLPLLPLPRTLFPASKVS